MGKKSSPPPPDYTAVAKDQAQQQNDMNVQNTWANRANQYTPWGSQTWNATAGTDPATGKPITQWSQTTNLDPRLQETLDSQLDVERQRSQLAQGLTGRMQSEYSTPMDWGNMQGWNSGPNAYGMGAGPQQQNVQMGLDFGGTQNVQGADQSRQRAEDAIYKSSTSRLDPQWNQRQAQMEAQLANKGITAGSSAYTKAMDDFNRQKTDAYQQASMGAITGGGAEAQRNQGMDMALRQQQVGEIGQQGQFGNQAAQQAWMQSLGGAQFGQQQQQQSYNQQMQSAQFQNQLRQNQLTEAMQKRGFSLNEINALLNGQQVSMPSFGNYNQATGQQAPDLMGAAQGQYQAQIDQSNASNARSAGMMQGIGSIASTAGMVML